MGYPVHKFLEEFETDEARLSNIVRSLRERPQPDASERAIAGRVNEAHARGYAEGRAAAEENLNADLAALRADCEAQLERSRAVFSEALAEKLSSDLKRQIDAVHDSISESLVSALLPIMRHVLAEAAVREMAASLNDLLTSREALGVELRGPKELIDRVTDCVREREASEAPQASPPFKCIVDDDCELRITANDTIIEARLMNWIQRVEAAVA